MDSSHRRHTMDGDGLPLRGLVGGSASKDRGEAQVRGDGEVERRFIRPESADWLRWWELDSLWTAGLMMGLVMGLVAASGGVVGGS